MKNFFSPRSIAVIGASAKEGKVGNIIFKNLLQAKNITLYPVNNSCSQVLGIKTFSHVQALPENIDCAIIAIPAIMVTQAVQDCAEKGIKNLIIISAGFSETGAVGQKLEHEILMLVNKYQLSILGPNCLGLINTEKGLNATFAKSQITAGQVGLIMQSGAFVTALLDLAQKEPFGFSKIITLGNKLQMDEVDFLQYLEKDESTKIVGLYLENIKNGEKFLEVLKRITKIKPVLILKAGNSIKAQKAIISHTGAMAGEATVAEEMLKNSGALFFDNLFDFIGTLRLFASIKTPRNENLVIVTNAGGPAVITTDLVEKNKNLALYEFSLEEKNSLKEILPKAGTANNPVDILGDAQEDIYAKVLKKITSFRAVGAILCIITPQAQTPIKEICQQISTLKEIADCPIIPIVIGDQSAILADEVLLRDNLKNFIYPCQAVSALGHYCVYNNKIKKAIPEAQVTKINEKRKIIAQEIIKKAQGNNQEVLYYDQGQVLVTAYQINALKSVSIDKPTDLSEHNFYFPVVAKIDSLALLHKNAHGGLVLNIQNIKELTEQVTTLKENFPNEKIIIQKQIDAGVEMIVGIKKDASFGAIVLLGIGGILTEVINSKLLWKAPMTQQEILEKIKTSRLGIFLQKQKIPLEKVVAEVAKVGQLAFENPEINELDLNPIIFYPQKPSITVDIKVLLK